MVKFLMLALILYGYSYEQTEVYICGYDEYDHFDCVLIQDRPVITYEDPFEDFIL